MDHVKEMYLHFLTPALRSLRSAEGRRIWQFDASTFPQKSRDAHRTAWHKGSAATAAAAAPDGVQIHGRPLLCTRVWQLACAPAVQPIALLDSLRKATVPGVWLVPFRLANPGRDCPPV